MNFLSLCGVAICVGFIIIILKEIGKNQAFLLSLSIGVMFFGIVLYQLRDVFLYIETLSVSLDNKSYVTSLIKALGIAYATEITQEICKSCGENSIAFYVESIGKAEIIVVCLPMIKELTLVALRYI